MTAVALAGTWLWSVPLAAEVDLRLLPVVLETDAQVEFQQSFSEPVAELPDGWRDWLCERTASYRVCADLEQIQPNRYRTMFSYVVYVRPRAATDGGGWSRFRFLSKPLGRFQDQELPVDFALVSDDGTEEGTLRLPIHSLSSDHFLDFRLPEIPVRLPIGGGETCSIDLVNRLGSLDLLVGRNLRVSSDKVDLWDPAPTVEIVPALPDGQEDFPLRPDSLARGKIRLSATPVQSRALLASVIPYPRFGSGVEGRLAGIHDRITVYVPYRTRGGISRELPVEIPIRFWPSVWALVAAVLLGAFLGSLLLRLLRRGFANWPWELAASLVIALITWLVALLLVSLDSHVKILGLEIDPYQIVPAGLLGILAALGGRKGAPVLRMVPGLRSLGRGADEDEASEDEGAVHEGRA